MRKRFTIKPIGAEYSHPKFAGVNNALLPPLLCKRLHFNPLPAPLTTTVERSREDSEAEFGVFCQTS